MLERILIADDNAMDRQLLAELLGSADDNIEVLTASDGVGACTLLEKEGFDVVMTDLKMPGCDGLEVLKKVKSFDPAIEVVLISGYEDVSSAVEAMKSGAFDYLVKPLELDHVLVLLEKLRERLRLLNENKYLHAELGAYSGNGNIVGQSRVMEELCRQVRHVAGSDATVLLQGESGTGKELISHLLHRCSRRRDKAFIRVNCAALSESILESELFGHEKGAFTGAVSSRHGRFELADGGTLLLDEISETSEKLQAELLRVIEEKEFERVGGSKTISVDVRIIATTNKDLAVEVSEKKFREDLFYRLNVVPLYLPPLRDRQGDIELLSKFFVEKFSERLGKPAPEIDERVYSKFRSYPWPGNVRELENLMQRLVIMDVDGVLDPADLPPHLLEGSALTRKDEGMLWGGTLEDMERRLILQTLKRTGGNRRETARRLGISTRTIRNKLKAYEEAGREEKVASP